MFDMARALLGAGGLDGLLGGRTLDALQAELPAAPPERLVRDATAAMAEVPAEARAEAGANVLAFLRQSANADLLRAVLAALGGAGTGAADAPGLPASAAAAVAAGVPAAVAGGLAAGNVVALGRVVGAMLGHDGLNSMMTMFDAADGETGVDRVLTGLGGMLDQDDTQIDMARVMANPVGNAVFRALLPRLVAEAG